MRLHPIGRFDDSARACTHITVESLAAAMWDSRLYLHQAFNDDDGFRREMHRTIADAEP